MNIMSIFKSLLRLVISQSNHPKTIYFETYIFSILSNCLMCRVSASLGTILIRTHLFLAFSRTVIHLAYGYKHDCGSLCFLLLAAKNQVMYGRKHSLKFVISININNMRCK